MVHRVSTKFHHSSYQSSVPCALNDSRRSRDPNCVQITWRFLSPLPLRILAAGACGRTYRRLMIKCRLAERYILQPLLGLATSHTMGAQYYQISALDCLHWYGDPTEFCGNLPFGKVVIRVTHIDTQYCRSVRIFHRENNQIIFILIIRKNYLIYFFILHINLHTMAPRVHVS